MLQQLEGGDHQMQQDEKLIWTREEDYSSRGIGSDLMHLSVA